MSCFGNCWEWSWFGDRILKQEGLEYITLTNRILEKDYDVNIVKCLKELRTLQKSSASFNSYASKLIITIKLKKYKCINFYFQMDSIACWEVVYKIWMFTIQSVILFLLFFNIHFSFNSKSHDRTDLFILILNIYITPITGLQQIKTAECRQLSY